MSKYKIGRGSDNPTRREPAGSSAKRDSGSDGAAQYRRRRRVIRLGQVLMAAGAVIAVVHMLAHFGALGGGPSGWQDLAVGYPTAGLLFLGGAVAAGQ